MNLNYKQLEMKLNVVSKDKGMGINFEVTKGSEIEHYQIWDRDRPRTKMRNYPLVSFFANRRVLIYDLLKVDEPTILHMIREFRDEPEEDRKIRKPKKRQFNKNISSRGEMVSRNYISQKYGVSYPTIEAWLRDGLKYYLIPYSNGTQIKVRKEDIKKYLESKSILNKEQ